jgi:hypothetical protein
MPFDPKLIHPENAPLLPDGEIDLPPELAALADQLRDDSAHLAARYPAARSDAQVAARPATRRKWTKIAALAASAAATLLVSVVAIEWFGGAAERSPIVANQPADRPALANPGAPASAAVPTVTHGSAAISLTELSGPELEALLDLWQREPKAAEAAGISF